MIVYRGDCKEVCSSQICSKGFDIEAEIMAGNDDVFVGNMGITIHPSENNSAHLHNICSYQYKSGWLSCTTEYEVAYKFATAGNIREGSIFTIEVPDKIYEKISKSDHNIYAQNNGEFEVLLNLSNYEQKIPKEWVIERTDVEPI